MRTSLLRFCAAIPFGGWTTWQLTTPKPPSQLNGVTSLYFFFLPCHGGIFFFFFFFACWFRKSSRRVYTYFAVCLGTVITMGFNRVSFYGLTECAFFYASASIMLRELLKLWILLPVFKRLKFIFLFFLLVLCLCTCIRHHYASTSRIWGAWFLGKAAFLSRGTNSVLKGPAWKSWRPKRGASLIVFRHSRTGSLLLVYCLFGFFFLSPWNFLFWSTWILCFVMEWINWLFFPCFWAGGLFFLWLFMITAILVVGGSSEE